MHLCADHFNPYYDHIDDNINHSSTIDDEVGQMYQVF